MSFLLCKTKLWPSRIPKRFHSLNFNLIWEAQEILSNTVVSFIQQIGHFYFSSQISSQAEFWEAPNVCSLAVKVLIQRTYSNLKAKKQSLKSMLFMFSKVLGTLTWKIYPVRNDSNYYISVFYD